MSKYSDIQKDPLDVRDLQSFIIPIGVKQHNMKENNCYIMKNVLLIKARHFNWSLFEKSSVGEFYT